MKYTSILEKLQCLFQLIGSSSIYLVFLGIMMVMLVMFFARKIKKTKFMVMMVVLYLSLFLVVIVNNYESLNGTFDSIMTNIFTSIYFPSVYVYLFILLVVDISSLVSLFNIRTSKVYKIINGICFGIIQFILVIIMEIIAENKIDIFSKSSLFTNANLVMMLELSVNIFIVWLISLVGVYLVNMITERILVRETDKVLDSSPAIINSSVLEVSEQTLDVSVDDSNLVNDYLSSNDNKIQEEVSYNNIEGGTIENNFSLNDLIQKSASEVVLENNVISDDVVTDDIINTTNNIESKMGESVNNASVFDMILNNTLPVIKEENIKEVEKDVTNYTLNDYRIFNRMLKEIRMYNIGSIVNIDRALEMRLLDKFSSEEYNLFKKMLKNYSN